MRRGEAVATDQRPVQRTVRSNAPNSFLRRCQVVRASFPSLSSFLGEKFGILIEDLDNFVEFNQSQHKNRIPSRFLNLFSP